MFMIQYDELILLTEIWVFKLDPNISSLDELVAPKIYNYKGISNINNNSILQCIDISNDIEFNIPVSVEYGQVSTGFYIIAGKRSRIIEILYNIKKRPLMDITFNHIVSGYLNKLKEEKPEWII